MHSGVAIVTLCAVDDGVCTMMNEGEKYVQEREKEHYGRMI